MYLDDTNTLHIAPQRGPQNDLLTSSADIAIFGGGAGGGKSYALLLEPLRHFNNPLFGGVIFRRTSVQVRNQGGLWDESVKLYSQLGARPRQASLEWIFPTGWRLKFAHLEHAKTVYDWQGSQLAFVGFDELVHFEESQFWYMLSRVRSASGVPGYVRATCNPDADSWVRKLIDWWVGPDGLPIKARAGVLRWFIRRDDAFIWGHSRQDLIDRYGAEELPKSITFIPSKLEDNPILERKDPSYRANLRALNRVDRERLEKGNWNVRASAGMLFQRLWFPLVDAIPAGFISAIRFWDRAATRPNEVNKDPDWTRGLKLLRYRDGTFLVADLKSLQDSPGQVERLIVGTAGHDGRNVRVMAHQDPGSAGVKEAEFFKRMLAGYDVRTATVSSDKVVRAKAVSAQCEAGNIYVLRAPWNEEFFKELENFGYDSLGHDDIVDAFSGAFNELSVGMSLADCL